MQIDLLHAELEREALLGRRAEALELHAEHLCVEAYARSQVARGKDDMVDVVDHQMILLCLKREISAAPNPREAKTCSVCSPSFDAGLRIAPGVAESLGMMPGTLSGSPSPARTSWIMPRAA